ncbi:hypothetical protein VTL71DRAFT_2079 [Oculimacula yallundae]|uniref:Ubiquitin-like domain-containing protein n=1 Tax=Oculimacula yallundae TaxID=86028 RepID=A0ABR4CA19_9HELO
MMEPLTIGAAIPGLIALSSKIGRLLKGFISCTNAAESMTTILAHVTSISTALNTLKSILDSIHLVPTKTQEAIQLTHLAVPLTGSVFAFSVLEKVIDHARRDIHFPFGASNSIDGSPLEGFLDADCMRDDIALEKVLWAIENTDEYVEASKGLNVGTSINEQEGESVCQDSEENIPFDQDSWDKSSRLFSPLLGGLDFQIRMFQALVGTLQRYSSEVLASQETANSRNSTTPGHLDQWMTALSNLTVETFQQNSHLPAHIQQMKELSTRFEENLPASPSAQRLKFGYQTYLQGKQTSTHALSGSLAQPANANGLNTQVLPITPQNASRSWYHILPPPTSPSLPTSPSPEFTISIKSLTGAVTQYNLSSETTCLELKRAIERNDGLRLEQQYLVCEPDNRWLPESAVLVESGVREGTRIHILLPFWGRGRM